MNSTLAFSSPSQSEYRMQYCRITEIYSTFLSCLRNGQHPAGCSQPFVFAIRLHPVSRDIPSQSECLNGCVVPLQLRILGTTRGEIVQAEGVYNCCSCSLKCSDLQRGKIKRKASATCENQTSQYNNIFNLNQFDTSILMLQCISVLCMRVLCVWKGSCSRGSSFRSGLQFIGYRPHPMWVRKAWAVCAP